MYELLEYSPIIVFLLKIFTVRQPDIFTGMLFVNILVNTVLKQIFKGKRPKPTSEYGNLQKYGMPSGHSQLLWFMYFYNKEKMKVVKYILLLFVISGSLYRIYSGKHTIIQTVIGGILGYLMARVSEKLIHHK